MLLVMAQHEDFDLCSELSLYYYLFLRVDRVEEVSKPYFFYLKKFCFVQLCCSSDMMVAVREQSMKMAQKSDVAVNESEMRYGLLESCFLESHRNLHSRSNYFDLFLHLRNPRC